MKRPSFQFYPGDWLRDTALRSCSLEARGLWHEMICWMHEGEPYGHLKVNSKVILSIHLAGMVGEKKEKIDFLLDELEDAGVFSRDSSGCIFSRRMVQDEINRKKRSVGGKLGGNPKLIGKYDKPGFVYAMERLSDQAIKIGISAHPEKRIYKIRKQYPNDEISLIGKKYFDNMGENETKIHNTFLSKKQGEWFNLNTQEKDHLLSILGFFHLKENPKENPTPSSSSSSSSKDKTIMSFLEEKTTVIDELNRLSHSKFKPTSKDSNYISARLKEGHTVEECLLVVRHQTRLWLETDNDKYLRPSTLFNSEKFGGYLSHASRNNHNNPEDKERMEKIERYRKSQAKKNTQGGG